MTPSERAIPPLRAPGLAVAPTMLEKLIRAELATFAWTCDWFSLADCWRSTWLVQDSPHTLEGIAIHMVYRGLLEHRFARRYHPRTSVHVDRSLIQYRMTELAFAELELAILESR